MLLSLLGARTSRSGAKQLFLLSQTNPGYSGASLDDVLHALRKSGVVCTSRWKFFRRFRLKAICDALLDRRNSYRIPTLLYFGIVHGRLGSRAKHFSVITHVDNNRLELLDPLGPRPSSSYNVKISHSQSDAPSRVHVIGCNYLVNERAEAALLLRAS